jgi:hypothetical protein
MQRKILELYNNGGFRMCKKKSTIVIHVAIMLVVAQLVMNILFTTHFMGEFSKRVWILTL